MIPPRPGAHAFFLLALAAQSASAGTEPATMAPGAELLLPLDCDSLPLCFRDGMALDAEQDQEVRRVLAEARRQREELREDTFRRLRAVLSTRQAALLEARRAALLAGEARRLGRRAECLLHQDLPAQWPR
jgi:hypothetical protein